MPIKLKVNLEGLDLTVKTLERKRGRIADAVQLSVNTVGWRTLEQMAQNLAADTGVAVAEARQMFDVSPATRGKASFTISAGRVLTEAPRTRPVAGRTFSDGRATSFEAGELVNIVTMEDEKVCKLCEALAENGPYTIEEARAQVPHHINCRCQISPARQMRRPAPQTTVARGRGSYAMTTSMKVRELTDELKMNIREALRG